MKTHAGGCACGSIRYEATGEPLAMVDCQCRQCQRESGTGHQSHIVFPSDTVRITGEASRYEMTGDGGTLKSRAFCPACGAPVYMTFPANPALVVLRAASLDDPAAYRPQAVTWTDAGYEWDKPAPGVPHFEKMPPG